MTGDPRTTSLRGCLNRTLVKPGSKPYECLCSRQREQRVHGPERDCVGSNRETSVSGSQPGGEWEEQRPQWEEGLVPSLAGHRRKIGLCSCPALRCV